MDETLESNIGLHTDVEEFEISDDEEFQRESAIMDETLESNIDLHTDVEEFEISDDEEFQRASAIMDETLESNIDLHTDVEEFEKSDDEELQWASHQRDSDPHVESAILDIVGQMCFRKNLCLPGVGLVYKVVLHWGGRKRVYNLLSPFGYTIIRWGEKPDGTSVDEPSDEPPNRKRKKNRNGIYTRGEKMMQELGMWGVFVVTKRDLANMCNSVPKALQIARRAITARTARDWTSSGEPPNKKRKRNESFESPTTPASVVNCQEIPKGSEGTSTGEPPNIKRKRNKSFEIPHTPASVVQFQEIPGESVKRTISMVDRNSTDEPPTNKRERIGHDENANIPVSVVKVQEKSQEPDGVLKTLGKNVENLANTCKRASENLIKDIPSTATKMLWEPIFIAMTIFTNIVQDTPSTVTKSFWNPLIAVMSNLTSIEKDVPLTLVKRLCDCMDRIIQFAKHTVQDVQSTLFAKLSDSMVNLTAFIENILQESGKIPELISGIIQRAANTNLSDKLLSRFAGLIGKNWEILGFELGLNAVEIDHISADNKSISMAIFAMLRKWVTSKQEEAKANDLLRAMWNCKVVNVNWEGLATVFI